SRRARDAPRRRIVHRRRARRGAAGAGHGQTAACVRHTRPLGRGPERIRARGRASRARATQAEEGSLTVPVTSITRTSAGDAPRSNVIAVLVLLAWIGAGILAMIAIGNPAPLIVCVILGGILMQSPKIAQQWERAIVLRLGRFVGLRGPGLFWIIPFVDHVFSWVYQLTY